MKKLLSLIILLLVTTTSIAENPVKVEVFTENKTLFIEDYFPSITVSELMARYPEIESVSIKEYGQTFGYINAFGGIGTNFLFESQKPYEIYVTSPITLELKE